MIHGTCSARATDCGRRSAVSSLARACRDRCAVLLAVRVRVRSAQVTRTSPRTRLLVLTCWTRRAGRGFRRQCPAVPCITETVRWTRGAQIAGCVRVCSTVITWCVARFCLVRVRCAQCARATDCRRRSAVSSLARTCRDRTAVLLTNCSRVPSARNANNRLLTCVRIPASVTSIGDRAFRYINAFNHFRGS